MQPKTVRALVCMSRLEKSECGPGATCTPSSPTPGKAVDHDRCLMAICIRIGSRRRECASQDHQSPPDFLSGENRGQSQTVLTRQAIFQPSHAKSLRKLNVEVPSPGRSHA